MKLKCDKHGRRIQILKNLSWIHRTGDGSKCDATTAQIGDQKIQLGDKILQFH